MDETSDVQPQQVAEVSSGRVQRRRLPLPGITFVVVFFAAALLIIDFSDVLFAGRHRRAALELVKPGMRLTQAERALNQAGYVTLYIDKSPHSPLLQVSTLSKLPFSAMIIHEAFGHTDADTWLLFRLSNRTRFFVKSNLDGTVQFTSAGRPAIIFDDRPTRGL